MNTYILLYKQKKLNKWNRVYRGEASSEKEFIDQTPDHILENYEWMLFEAEEKGHQDDYLHSGEMDEVLPRA